MSKHTPAPWKAHDDEDNGFTIEAGRSGIIAEGLDEADARLIAAAPDLLAALKRLSAGLHDELDSNPRIKAEEVRAARAAIAKAEGAS